MRKLVPAAALLLVLAGAAIWLLPGIVDWNALKPEIAAAVKRFAGRNIVIDGRIRVSLLPKPLLIASELHIEPESPGQAPPLSLDALELQLSPLPLLLGQLRIARLRLLGPTLTLLRDADNRLNWQWPAANGGSESEWHRLALEDVAVSDGRVIWIEAGGRNVTLSQINLTAAGSPTGTLSGQGGFTVNGESLTFALRIDRHAASGRIGIPLARLSRPDDGAEAAFRGAVAADGTIDGKLSFKFADAGEAMRTLGWPTALAQFPSLPLSAEARIRSGDGMLDAEELTLTLAQQRLNGRLRLTLGEAPQVEGELKTAWLDLDAMLRDARSAGGSSRPFDWYLPPDLSGRIELRADGVTWRGGVMRQVDIGLAIAEGRPALTSAHALLPGGGEVQLTAASDGGGSDAFFGGRIEARADNLRRLATWLGFDLEHAPPGRPGRLSLSGALQVTPELLRLADTSLRIDDTVAQGGIVYRLQGRPSFGLDLSLDELDLADYLPPEASVRALPLAALQAFDTNVILKARRIGFGGEQLENLSLDLGLVGGQLTVREARLRLGGGNLLLHASASNLAGTPNYIGDMQIAEPTPGSSLARLLGQPPPATADVGALLLDLRFEGQGSELSYQASGHLGETAIESSGKLTGLPDAPSLEATADWREARLGQALSAVGLDAPAALDRDLPVDLTLRLSGTPTTLDLTAEGALAGARFRASGSAALAVPPTLDLKLQVTHEESRDFAARLGFADLISGFGGPLSIAAHLRSGIDNLSLDDLELALGDQHLTGAARLSRSGVLRHLEAALSAGAVDLAPWLSMLSELAPELFRRLDGTFRLHAERLGLDGRQLDDAELALDFAPGMVAIQKLSGTLYGGELALGGRLVAADQVALELSGRLRDADLASAAGDLLGIDGIAGKLSASLELQAFAADLPGLGRHLGGSLTLEARDGHVAGLSLGALPKTPIAGKDGAAVAAGLFGHGSSGLKSARGRWQLQGGIMHTDDTSAALDGAELALTGEVDLATRRLDLRMELRPALTPEPPVLILRLTGDAASPEWSLDADAFAAYLSRRDVP